ncbi:DUF998 domain-containing protein [Spirillospora sp. NBC_01491]|uniref:DUF998 domain-containing protein n=1 Tax=Spirillospora sp. NBC_01491 TaxID=2976007 RepID=UPI002E32D13D|nr:DUF998 domain-containing protein [Spirillospora sp. NBC_01491]
MGTRPHEVGTRSPAGRPGAVPGFAVVLNGVAAVAYATFFLEHLLSPDLDVINGYVSELSAVDQPYDALYSGGDFVTGLLIIIVAATCLLTLRRRPWATAGWTLLMLFGVCAIGDAVFPLDCAPSLESRCALLERSENVSFSHEFHSVTSSAVVMFGVASLFTLSIAAHRYGWWPFLARWGWVLAALESAAGFATLLAMLLGQWLGIIQRIQIGILCLGLLVIGWALYTDWRAARSDRRRPGAEPGTGHEREEATP